MENYSSHIQKIYQKIKRTRLLKTYSLPDLALYSFDELRNIIQDTLSWSDTRRLYNYAQEKYKENKIYEAKVFSKRNPQLTNNMALALGSAPHQRSYEDLFGSRASRYSRSGSVASMFSPAGYLTEMYREARDLHYPSSVYNLDSRRPDLAALTLSQENLDQQVTTLSLANEVSLALYNEHYGGNLPMSSVYQLLAQHVRSGETPYNHYYETMYYTLLSQDPTLSQLSQYRELYNLGNVESFLGIGSHISPELYKILIENIDGLDEKDLNFLYDKYFKDIPEDYLMSADGLRDYYYLSNDEIRQFIGDGGFIDSYNQGEYINDQLLRILTDASGKLEVIRLKRVYDTNKTQNRFINFYPLNHELHRVEVNFANSYGVKIELQLDNKTIATLNEVPQVGKVYTFDITIPNLTDRDKVNIKFKRPNETGTFFFITGATFNIEKYSLRNFALRLNKAIRLYKATGLSPVILNRIFTNVAGSYAIDSITMQRLFYTLLYIKRYGLSAEDAVILAGGVISRTTEFGTSLSQFDRLFNHPPLNGQYFEVDDKNISLSTTNESELFTINVIKRTLELNDVEFRALVRLHNNTSQFTNNLKTLSEFLRLKSLTELTGITFYELLQLYPYLPLINRPMAFTESQWHQFGEMLFDLSSWLTTQQITSTQLFMMLVDKYDTTLTPEINSLLSSVRAGVGGLTSAEYGDYAKLSNTFAAALGLSSTQVTHSLLQWLDALAASDEQRTKDFVDWLVKTPNVTQSTNGVLNTIKYVHRLGQLMLIYQACRLDEATLVLAVNQPQTLMKNNTLPRDLTTIKSLCLFSGWMTGLGENQHGIILTALSNNKLDAQHLAQAENWNIDSVTLAIEQAVKFKQITSSDKFAAWSEIESVLNWVNASAFFNVTAKNMGELIELDYKGVLSTNLPRWINVSRAFVATLDSDTAYQVNNQLDEGLSPALSTVLMRDVLKLTTNIKTRDELYQYLLIDNQVSSVVKTTRIAEAISSLQLYINMALDGAEPNAKSDVISRQFFSDWQTYNKSYSTWAGVSQLVYYPENYVDPTRRIGQTGMMDDFLQHISQNKINSDDVEDGFVQYLTRFEQVANLNVIAGYHDNVDTSQGKSYLLGLDNSGIQDYYWRTLDQSKFAESKYPANAWSEWNKIECACLPYQNLIQPVVYKSRLYVVWLERKDIERKDVEIDLSASGNVTSVGISDYIFELKLSHIRYDGTWRPPLTIDCSDKIKHLAIENKLDLASFVPGLYVSAYQNEDTLLTMFYVKDKVKQNMTDANVAKVSQGLYIYADLTTQEINSGQLKRYVDVVFTQLMTDDVVKVINRYAEDYDIPSSVTVPKYSLGWTELTRLSGSVPYIRYKASSSSLDATIRMHFEIDNTGKNKLRNYQIGLIKRFGGLGDKIWLCNSIGYEDDFHAILTVPEQNSTDGIVSGFGRRATNFTFYVPRPSNGFLDPYGHKVVHNYIVPNSSMRQERFYNAVRGMTVIEMVTSNLVVAHPHIDAPAIYVDTGVSDSNIQAQIRFNNKTDILSATSPHLVSVPTYAFDVMNYTYKDKTYDLSDLELVNNRAEIEITYQAINNANTIIGREIFVIPITKTTFGDKDIITIHTEESGAQYLERGPYRTRLNTLFARQLVERADMGIDTILNLDTQNIQEPKLGKGFYVQLTLPVYDREIHGNESWFKIYYTDFFNNQSLYLCYSGFLSSENETNITLFYPYPEGGWKSKNVASLQVSYYKSANVGGLSRVRFTYDPETDTAKVDNVPTHVVSSAQVTGLETEPMDFAGANALYFWELFYYTPMMISQRFLQEAAFTEAQTWLNYIWNPGGYIIAGEHTDICWNVRPLLEETSWNKDPLDSVDPDAVAQNDPMHYKVATFMHALDILIAQGDAAYRRLERDSLNEAKLFYVKASNLLGVEPYIHDSAFWDDPQLGKAADTTSERLRQLALFTMTSGGNLTALQAQLMPVVSEDESEEQDIVDVVSETDIEVITESEIELFTANSLMALFLPQVNEKLTGYWRLLEQRLYNLRNNLSLTGQPLNLPVYPVPASPDALLSSAALSSSGEGALPSTLLPSYRFEPLLASARNMVSQLTQFGSSLLSVIERQDAEEQSEQLLSQAIALAHAGIDIQSLQRTDLEAERDALKAVLASAQQRLRHYSKLYQENINVGEQRAINLRNTANSSGLGAHPFRVAGAAANTAPNVFGFSCGGCQWGAISTAMAGVIEFKSLISNGEAEKISQTETYRRRREEWQLAMQQAEKDIEQITAQLAAFDIRIKSSDLQLAVMKQEQENTAAQLSFLKTKFSNKTLYSWIRGKLAAIYYQYFDLTQAMCLMAQEAYRRDIGNSAAVFIRPGNWQSARAGLMAGETLTLNLAQMEKAYLEQNTRGLEVTRTVSLAEVYANQNTSKFTLTEEIKKLVTGSATTGSAGTTNSGIALKSGELQATITLSDLAIDKDYASGLGNLRRIKQISVTLPALVGPYQDIRAVLSYGGSAVVPKGCDAIAVSHGMNDSGQFMLDFNEQRWLPFEGIPVNDKGTLTLSLPDIKGKQQVLALSLNDIILHIRYTIQG